RLCALRHTGEEAILQISPARRPGPRTPAHPAGAPDRFPAALDAAAVPPGSGGPPARPAVSAAAPPREHRRKQRRPRTGGGGRANRPGSARGAGGERGREGCGNGTGPARGAGPAGPGGGAGRSVGWVGGSPWPVRTPQVNRNAISARATTAVQNTRLARSTVLRRGRERLSLRVWTSIPV